MNKIDINSWHGMLCLLINTTVNLNGLTVALANPAVSRRRRATLKPDRTL